MNSLVSVIIPVYKVEKYLDECVESVVNQTYKNLEIILIDDGSPDACPGMCDNWANKDDRIRVIHQNNQGLSKSREIGILSSKGDFICFVDSDDYCHEDLVATVIDKFEKNAVDIVVFDACRVSECGKKMDGVENICEEEISALCALEKLIDGDINNYFWNKVYKRSVFKGIEFLHGILWEDMCTMYKVFLKAERIYCCPKQLYYYRQREGSIISSISEKALQDIFFVRTKRYNDLICIDERVAEKEVYRVGRAALRLYDRSLWAQVDEKYLSDALEFLKNNKDKILSSKKDKNLSLFYKNRGMYNKLRLLKHKIGNLLKRKKD